MNRQAKNVDFGVRSEIWTLLAVALFGFTALILFLSAPHHGEFWWSDSPRHALNGVFVADLVSTLPADPKAYAIHYYLQYPALTILFYPPLFYVISAPFYLIFGVSHATALGVVELHYFAVALGLFVLTRRWLGPPLAIVTALAVMVAPGVALWGRQVMLEIPSLAFLTWSVVACTSYLSSKRPVLLYLAAFLVLAAIYTKINAAFTLPAFALAILVERKSAALRDKHVWFVALLLAVGLVPIAVLTVKFGGANVQSVVGIADSNVSRTSLAGWLWYARQLPFLVGWPLLLLALLTPLLAVLGRFVTNMSRAEATLLVAWFVLEYIALSLIDLKDARFAVLFAPPLLVSAGLSAYALLQANRAASLAYVVIVLGTGVYLLVASPVPSVAGYRQAAQWITTHAPKNAIVVFSGKRDGSFIFNLRSFSQRHDISTIRVDKLLLTVSVRRTLGYSQKDLSETQIAQMLDDDGVSYVVAQEDFWTDIPVIRRFQNVLHGPHFARLVTIPVVANVPSEDKVVYIYKNLGRINPHPKALEMPLAIIGQTVSGKVGK